MNKVRVYNDNEIKILLSNPNVERIKNKSQIVYKNEFKLYAVKEKINHSEKTARQIFEEGKFDMNILDDRTPQKRICSWVKKYKMFGEDYFTNKNKYSYKALEQNKKCNLNNMFRDDKIIVYVIEKKDDCSIESRVVRKLDDEKINS